MLASLLWQQVRAPGGGMAYDALARGDEGWSYRILRDGDYWTLCDSHPGLIPDDVGEDEIEFATLAEAKDFAERLELYWYTP